MVVQTSRFSRCLMTWDDEAALEKYLTGLIDKNGFDHSGLIYGMGHAVYTNSDPRARILKGYAERLAQEKGRTKEFELYKKVEEISGRLLAARRRSGKPISANVEWICIYDARYPYRAVYSYICHRTYCRMVGA